MRIPLALLLSAYLAGCASLSAVSSPTRDGLWRQAHHALRADSFGIAVASFEQLAAEFPETAEGHDARFFLGALYLDPRNPTFDPDRSLLNLDLFLAADSAKGRRTRRPEARALRALADEAALPCEERTGPLRCEPATIIVRTSPEDTVVVRTPAAEQAAEIARLRQQVTERDATIRQLRDELQRIRNTLAPRP